MVWSGDRPRGRWLAARSASSRDDLPGLGGQVRVGPQVFVALLWGELSGHPLACARQQVRQGCLDVEGVDTGSAIVATGRHPATIGTHRGGVDRAGMATQLREGTAIDRVPDDRGAVLARGDHSGPVRAEGRAVDPPRMSAELLPAESLGRPPGGNVPGARGPVCAAGDQPAPVRAEPDGGQRFGVAGHLRLHLARPAAPQTPDPVAAPGGDALAVGAERNAPDGALVPDQDALGRAGIWALRPPDSRRPIEAAGHDAGPLRAEGDRGHLPGVPAQLDQDLTGPSVTDSGCAVPARGHDALAVRAEYGARDLTPVAGEAQDGPPRGDVPDTGRVVAAGGHQSAPVGTEGHVEHRPDVTAQLLRGLVSVRIPQPSDRVHAGRGDAPAVAIPDAGGAVVARGDDALAIGAEPRAADGAGVALEPGQLPCGPRVPDAGRRVPARGADPAAVGAEDSTPHPVLVAAELRQLPTGPRVPDAGRRVLAGRDDPVPAGAEHRPADVADVSAHDRPDAALEQRLPERVPCERSLALLDRLDSQQHAELWIDAELRHRLGRECVGAVEAAALFSVAAALLLLGLLLHELAPQLLALGLLRLPAPPVEDGRRQDVVKYLVAEDVSLAARGRDLAEDAPLGELAQNRRHVALRQAGELAEVRDDVRELRA